MNASGNSSSYQCADPSVVLRIPLKYYAAYCVLAVLNAFSALTAVVGNAVILASIPKLKYVHAPSRALLFSLALSDIAVGFFLQPLFTAYIVGGLTKNFEIRCQARRAFGLASDFLVGVSYLTMTFITLDRFLALRLRLTYRAVVTFKRTVLCMVISWTLCAVFPIAHLLSTKLGLILITAFLLLFLILTSIFNFKIFRALHKHDVQVNDRQHRRNALNLSRYRKTLGMVMAVYSAHLLCYLPSTAATVAMIVCGQTPPLMLLAAAFGTLLLFNSALNPFLYCWRVRAFRAAAIGLLGLHRCIVLTPENSQSATGTLDDRGMSIKTLRTSGVRRQPCDSSLTF